MCIRDSSGTAKPLYNLLPGDTEFKIWFMSGGCQKFLDLFMRILEQMRRRQFQGPDPSFIDSLRSGRLEQNLAYADPSDPTTVYITQPKETFQNMNNQNIYGGYQGIPIGASAPPPQQQQQQPIYQQPPPPQPQPPQQPQFNYGNQQPYQPQQNQIPPQQNYSPMQQNFPGGGVQIGSSQPQQQPFQPPPPSTSYQPSQNLYPQFGSDVNFQQSQQPTGNYAPPMSEAPPMGPQQYQQQPQQNQQPQQQQQQQPQQQQQGNMNVGFYYGFGLGPKLVQNNP
eukprot:TRINITY_DN3712_c0_g1_i12.p1 TRINITY_DN3712_c0_g1~~TRINITY_DN3712_c0_g1_i12.p1  ORF type:complete len:281 (+),score=43.09 TRINITY_DN3712_c0_g1_i12:110-952(+)